MKEEVKSHKRGKNKKKGMARKPKKEGFGFDTDISNKKLSTWMTDGEAVGPKSSSKHQTFSDSQPSIIRKPVDPETAKYFSEISSLFESGGVDLDERSVVCGNALEEARGKEFELATDYIISHTLQTLLEGCDVHHLCGFLNGCAEVFHLIAMDRSGSHVAETALKSLGTHLQDFESFSVIEDTLTVLCKVILVHPIDMMCNCYGSHVLRSLLCLCGGKPINSPEFHGGKPLTILAERLNLKTSQMGGNDSPPLQQKFPGLLKFLVSEILKCAGEEFKIMQVDQSSSLVLQTALKLLAGHDEDLLLVIPIVLGCKKEDLIEGSFREKKAVGDIVELVKEPAFSRLMEVILDVTPESLYDGIFRTIFRNSLFELSSHSCGNFVVQALISHTRDKKQMELIWEELGSKFKDLLEMGRPGVVASLIAASQRLQTHEHKCCQTLAASVCLQSESPRCIVPRMLFLDSYFNCENRSCWSWPNGVKMHVMGSLILQSIFRFQSELIQPYIESLTSMEVDRVFEVAKDTGGARVIEAFLDSDASRKHKQRLIAKLRGHFGELAMHSSGSFTVEKCFTASNMSLREAIASDLLAVQNELSKTKQGPYLLRKLDIDGYANRPDQWRSKQASKQSTYKEFYAAFGSSKSKSPKSEFLSNTSKSTSNIKDVKKMREEIDHLLVSEKHAKNVIADNLAGKKLRSKKRHFGSDVAVVSKEVAQSVNQRPFLSVDMKQKKRRRNG